MGRFRMHSGKPYSRDHNMEKSERTTLLVIAAVIVVAALFTWYRVASQTSDDQLNIGGDTGQGPAVYLDLNDRPIALSQFDGTVRVINSWASWCPFCTAELPDLESLATEYADQNVNVLAINRAEPLRTMRSYLNSIDMANDTNMFFLQDQADSFYKKIGGITMPETVFYSTEGEVVVHKRGFMDLEEMRTHVNAAIAASAN